MPLGALVGTTASINPSISNVTTMRALGTFLRGLWEAAGLVRTADSGQVDWTTATITMGQGQSFGYEIYRLSDALQATKPVFIRVLYSLTANNVMTTLVSVGTATDGAGTLTSAPNTNTSVTTAYGHLTAGNSTISTGTAVNSIRTCYAYGDGSSACVALFPDAFITATSNSYGGAFLLERTRDLDGTPNGDGVLIQWLQYGAAGITETQPLVLGLTPPQPGRVQGRGMVPNYNPGNLVTTGVVGTQVYIHPWMLPSLPRPSGPSALLISPYRSDYATHATFSVSHYGTTRNFVSVTPGPGTMTLSLAMDSSTQQGIALRTS